MVSRRHIKHLVVLVVFLLDSCWLLPAVKAKSLQAAKSQNQKAAVHLPHGVSTGWWAKVQENIKRSEYNITWQQKTNLADLESAYQAPNRMQNLRTYFTLAGICVIQRTERASGWQFGPCLTGYGYAGMVKPVAMTELIASGNRIEYRRGRVIEWYVNDENGLEQGFTLTAPPQNDSGRSKQSKIILQITVAGDLTGRLTGDGKAVVFATSDGKDVINCGALHAKDATGRELGSQILLGEGTLTL